MGRPRKHPLTAEESAAIIASQINYIESTDPSRAHPQQPRIEVMRFQMGLPCDLLGSKISFAKSRNTSLEMTPLGIVMRSMETKRKMLVPWTNIKAAEFAWDQG